VPGTVTVEVRRGADRGRTTLPGIETRHAFSFGAHHEPGNTHHGLLLAHNEDRIAPGAGYDTHAHRDSEIVTWVLAGSLAHADSAGHTGVLRAGGVGRMSAGRGVEHSERHAERDPDAPALHLVQCWLVPDEPGAAPDHEQRDLSAALADGGVLLLDGGLQGAAMVMEGQAPSGDDPTKVDVQRITWTREADGVRQLWETSTDDGATWNVAFDGRYRRVPTPR